MANIPTNESYIPKNTVGVPKIPASFRNVQPYTPSKTYQNLAQINQAGGIFNPTPTPEVNTPEYHQATQAGISQYGRLVNEGMGIPTQTQFLPPENDPRMPIALPDDYGTFAEPMAINSNGQNISWSLPKTPVIKNLPGDVPGQYVQDTSNPDTLIKTERGSNPMADSAMRAGRLGSMYQIDHIIPLALGGADTLANRQLLTYEQNDKKTKAQAIPYTLYAHGDISLDEARVMASQWKDRDLTDVPQPNGIGLVSDVNGKTGIEIAREVSQRWKAPKPVTFKDVMAEVPQAAKDWGKGFLPNPVREFVKGAISGATLGFVPYEQGENQGMGSKISGIIGMIGGSLAPWSIASKVLAAPFAIAGGAKKLFSAKQAMTAKETAKAFNIAEDAVPALSTLNKQPGYVTKFLNNPEMVKQAGHFGATSAVFGQAHQFVANHLNPYVLSGQASETEQESMIGNILKDFSIGAVTGVASPTLKGTAHTVLTPMALSFWINPDDPISAITNGVLFGAMHGGATFKRPGYNDVKMFGGKPYENPVTQAYDHTLNHAAYDSLSHYNPKMDKVSMDKPVPKMSPEAIEEAKNNAINNVWQRFFFQKDSTSQAQKTTLNRFKEFSKDIDQKLDSPLKNTEIRKDFGAGYQTRNVAPKNTPELPQDGMDLQTALSEIKRITVSARQLYKGTLSKEMREKADLDDLLTFGKMVKDKNTSNLQNRFDSQIKFAGSDDPVINAPIAKQAVSSLIKADPEFMTKSTGASKVEPTGKYKTGDIALTGSAVNGANRDKAKYFFEQKEQGNASPNIILVSRPELAPLFSMRNKLLTPEQIKSGDYAIDANPENVIQAFGIVKNPQNKDAIELVELGMVASDHRLNLGTGKEHVAFNKHPAVQKWHDTNGAEGLKPLTPENHKDTIVNEMKKNNIDILVADIAPTATLQTIQSGQPFIPLRINDANWARSIELKNNNLTTGGNVNTMSADIAKINSSTGAKEIAENIQNMKNNPNRVKPASEYLPKADTNPDIETNRLVVPQETTLNVVRTLENSLNVTSPAGVKESFQNNFKILLTDDQAKIVFNNRESMTMKDGINLIVDAVNKGDASKATAIKLEFVKTYLQSGALKAEGKQAVLEMPLLGKNTKYTGVEEHQLPTAVKPPVVADPVALPDTITPVTQPDVLVPTAPVAPIKRPEAIPEAINPVTPVPAQLPDTITPVAQQGASNLPDTISPVVAPAPAPRGKPLASISLVDNIVNTAKEKPVRASAKNKDIEDIDESIDSRNMNDLFDKEGNTLPDEQRRISSEAVGAKDEAEVLSAEKAQKEWMTSHTPVDKPKFVASDFYKNLDEGMSNKDNLGAQYLAKSFDSAFKEMLGPDYRKDKYLPKILADYFRKVFFNEKNTVGRPIEQHKDIIEARGRGDFNAEKEAYTARNKQLKEEGVGEQQNLVAPEGMSIRPWFQEDSMVHNLTRGEDMMAALFSDVAQEGAKSVRAVNKLFVGGLGNKGLREFIIENHPKLKSKSVHLSKLEKEAEALDAKMLSEKSAVDREVAMAELELPKEKEKLESIIATMRPDPESPSPKWLTPDIAEDMVKESLEKINKYLNIIEKTKKSSDNTISDSIREIKKMSLLPSIKDGNINRDGAGGPGYDGKGGPGDMLGKLWGNLKKPFTSNVITYTAPKEAPKPEAPKPEAPKSFSTRGVSYTDSDLDEVSKILLGEVSNRTNTPKGDMRPFEVRHIVNTGINRVLANNPKEFGSNLTEVFQYPNAYQAYAPKGMIKDGKTVESEYQRAVAGNLDYPTQQKLKLIRDTLEEMKSEGFSDPTNGAKFYVHASDGTLWFGATGAEAKANALNHEKNIGISQSRFGTREGLPVN